MPSRWDRTAGLRRSVGILLGILLAVGAGFMLRSFEVATLEDQVDSWTAAANRAATELEQNDVTLADQTTASTALQLELQSKDERLIELEDVAVEYTLLQSTYAALQTASRSSAPTRRASRFASTSRPAPPLGSWCAPEAWSRRSAVTTS